MPSPQDSLGELKMSHRDRRKRILITGAGGTIGTALRNNLGMDYDYTFLVHRQTQVQGSNFKVIDLLRDYEGMKKEFEGQDAVIHLAISHEEDRTLNNLAMTTSVYKAAYEAKVGRLIMASSIHALGGYWGRDFTTLPEYRYIAKREFDKIEKIPLIRIDDLPYPDSVYGATKVYMEALGRYYADKGLQVIIIRFGGVNRDDSPLKGPLGEVGYYSVWFSHRDAGQLVRKCIEAENLPRYVVFWGVSNNRYSIFDISNAREMLGYSPEDDAEKFFEQTST
ncbi:MAG: NAD(P)-dependent oxidoreductase [Candidatus Bathyarchaeia archaeon]